MPSTPPPPRRGPASRPQRPERPRASALRPGDLVEMDIADIAGDGMGVGHVADTDVRVPFTIPGERVLARITTALGERGSFATAEGERLLEASADRTPPACAPFGLRGCVRCAWQHMNRAAQQALKADIILTEWEQASLPDVELRPTLASPDEWGYLWHATFSILQRDGDRAAGDAPDGDALNVSIIDSEDADVSGMDSEDEDASGADASDADEVADSADSADADTDDDDGPAYTGPGAMLGLPGRAGGVIAFTDCALLHPDLLDVVDWLDLAPLDLDAAQISRVRLARSSDGPPAITLYMRAETAPSLTIDQPASVNVLLADNTPMNLIGDSHTRYTVSGRSFRVTAGSFFRANVGLIGPLAAAVVDALALTPEDRVLDVFAGVGVFAAFLAERAALVTVIESYPPAATDCDENLAAFEHVTVIEGGAADVLEMLADEGETHTAAVVDLPGRRFDAELPGRLAALGVERVALIADHAGGFAYAARIFRKAGYRARFIQPVETMPHTHFTDVWGLFVRAGDR